MERDVCTGRWIAGFHTEKLHVERGDSAGVRPGQYVDLADFAALFGKCTEFEWSGECGHDCGELLMTILEQFVGAARERVARILAKHAQQGRVPLESVPLELITPETLRAESVRRRQDPRLCTPCSQGGVH